MNRNSVRRAPARLAVLAVVALAAAACGGLGGGGGAAYPSENFTWVVPYSPGGGFDTYSRGFAQVMAETQLPDGIDIGVENITPIAEALTGVYDSDSEYTLAMLPMPAAAAQEIQFPDIAQWETENFTILGSMEENAYVIYVRADGPYQTWEDLAAGSDLSAFTVERGSSSSLASAVAIRTLGLDADLTFGAEGSQEVATALVRGDIDFIVYGTSDVIGFIESGDLIPVLFLGTEDQRPPGFDWLDSAPSIADVGYPEAAGAVTEMRIVAAPAGLSDEAEAYLTEAVEATLFGDAFAAWAEEAGRPLVPRDAESARNAMQNQITTMQELVPMLVEEGLI